MTLVLEGSERLRKENDLAIQCLGSMNALQLKLEL